MAQATQKDPEFERAFSAMFGFDRRSCIAENVCAPHPIGCGKPVTGFRDQLSRDEYLISALCQHCQDLAFSVCGD